MNTQNGWKNAVNNSVDNLKRLTNNVFTSISDMLYMLFFYKQHQTEICRKNQAKAKQHPEDELLLLENYLLSFLSFTFFDFQK